ncbi:rod shape-determining protein [bacterium]|jgi:rod shape-determining protein MreB and related proteins|nr:rod shape-determining protein [bacterium]
MFKKLSKLLSFDIGIDLGTANTVVYVRGDGIVLREPSVVALDRKSGRVLAIGEEARGMVGRTPGNIIAVRPMRDGVIADFETTEAMIRWFIDRVKDRRRLMSPRVLVGIPYGITSVEKRAVLDAARLAGAKETYLIEEPMAAAIGSGVAVTEPTGHMVVDIGGGTTEVAVLSVGGIVVSESIRVAGDEFDEAIISHCRKNYNLLIGERMAEKVKIKIGSASPFSEEKTMSVTGRDLLTGFPKTFTLTATEVREAVSEPVSQILGALRRTLEKTPPELSSDIVESGILLTGGGSLLFGLAKHFYHETKVRIHMADDPLSCVALGTGVVLENMDYWLPSLRANLTH